MTWEIREATHEDVPAVVTGVRELLVELGGKPLATPALAETAHDADRRRQPGVVLVAEQRGRDRRHHRRQLAGRDAHPRPLRRDPGAVGPAGVPLHDDRRRPARGTGQARAQQGVQRIEVGPAERALPGT